MYKILHVVQIKRWCNTRIIGSTKITLKDRKKLMSIYNPTYDFIMEKVFVVININL